jgi:hypothetical protein
MPELMEFEVNKHNYRATKLDAFQQWNVTRRLLPVIGGAADSFLKAAKAMSQGKDASVAFNALLEANTTAIIEPLTQALGRLSDADSSFIITTCLSAVQRQQGPNNWAQMVAPNGRLMFAAEMDMVEMISIVWKVIEANLMSFSSGQSVNGSPVAGQPLTSRR